MRHHAIVSITLTVLLAASVLGACSVGSDESPALETDACRECRSLLVECASTVTTDDEFVACRDEWQACQEGKAIRSGHCSNPSDDEACGMCRARRAECVKGGDETCDSEFDVCKSLLITRGDVAEMCSPEEAPPVEILCNVCQKDYVDCVSDATGANEGLCAPKFELCMESNKLDRDNCRPPRGEEACTLCLDHHAACSAGGLTSCDADFGACADTIAPTCSLPGGEGGSGGSGEGGSGEGGSGGSGEGGSGGGTVGCAHDVCIEGPALDAECSTCAADVCALDSYCCDTEWDSYCTDAAYSLCGC